MRLTGLSSFLAMVTPQALEGYLQEKGWIIEPAKSEAHVHKSAIRGSDRLPLLNHPERENPYYRQRGLEENIEKLARDGEEHPLAVLYELLPPEHRQELVKAVFPELAEKRCAPQPPDLSKWSESPDCCEVWPRLLHGFGWFHLDERPDLLLMPFIEGKGGDKWRVNRCPACGVDRVAVVVSTERKEASEP